jgi:hypothetical protein
MAVLLLGPELTFFNQTLICWTIKTLFFYIKGHAGILSPFSRSKQQVKSQKNIKIKLINQSTEGQIFKPIGWNWIQRYLY